MPILRCLTLATIGLFLIATPLWAAPLSDELLVTDATTGAVLDHETTPETGNFPPVPGVELPIGMSAFGGVFSFPMGTTPTGVTQTLALLDPGTNNVSDLLTVQTQYLAAGGLPGSNDFALVALFTFNSDSLEQNLGGTVDFTTFETGSLQDVTSFFTLPNGSLKIQVLSDVEPRTVPEPASLLLLGVGIVGLAGVTWRRQRRK